MTYFLIIYSDTIVYEENMTLTSNEMIDIENNYYISIPVYLDFCTMGYAYQSYNNL